jgi:hypothetical protein
MPHVSIEERIFHSPQHEIIEDPWRNPT